MSDSTSGTPKQFRLEADLIAQRGFMIVRRGYDQDEVRAFLDQVAAEVATLQSQVQQLASAPPPPAPVSAPAPAPVATEPVELDEESVVALVGEETANVLRAAKTAAAELRRRAAAEAERIVDDARQVSGDMRREAEDILGSARGGAEAAAEALRIDARAEAAQIVAKARAEADSIRDQAEQERRLTVDGAQAVREKILGDLSRRRRVATVQIEQLRAGRERLLESYAVVRRTLEEVHEELQRADAEARAAADEAGRRAEADPEGIEARMLVADPPLSVAPSPAATPTPTHAPTPAPSEEPEPPTGGGATPAEPGAGDAGPGPQARAVGTGGAGGGGVRISAERAAPTAEAGPAPTSEGFVIAEDGIERVRVLRPRTDGGRSGAPTLRSVPGGRIAAGGGAAVQIAEPEPVRVSEPARVSEDTSATDRLFARIRSGRAADVDAARQLLAPPEAPIEVPGEGVPGSWPEGDDEGLQLRRSDEDEAVLQQRDRLIGDLEGTLAKKLKRALQDEQNELLDRLRGLRGAPKAATLLPDGAEHAARIASVARALLDEARRAGADLAGSSGRPVGADDEVADELATALITPLRRRLTDAVRESAGDDQAVLVEAIGTVYREWKTQRVEPAVVDAVASAFARGSFAAFPEGTLLRWVVEDTDGPCPDCDDNALAGYLPRGEVFPTGQLHPPAHAGCRCLLAPAE